MEKEAMNPLIWKTLEGAKLIHGKSVIITGAAAGIGRACARMFGHQGGRLALVDVDYEGVEKVCHEIEGQGGQAVAIRADVTKAKELEDIFQGTQNAYRGLDILINNAGGGVSTDFFEIDAEEWDRVVRLNLTSVFLMSQRAARVFRNQGSGVIVNVSSLAGRSMSPTAGCHYTSSKAGILGFTRHLARLLAPYSIRVNAVCPGVTNSERLAQRLEAQGRTEELNATIPLGRIADVDEVASACLFLASDLSTYITGASLDVNGGSLMI
jgi:3-oxoacyl-[acyl-carrier protein] reductase